MKNIITCLIWVCLLYACGAPVNFTAHYNEVPTGLDKRINIEGCYISQFGCDSAFFSVYMFYPDGLFTIATASNFDSELITCFEKGGDSRACKYPLWGTYRLDGDLIRTQTIRTEGNGCVVFRDYRILPDGSIVNVSDYVDPDKTNLGYMQNYPSYKTNECEVVATFRPLQTKRDRTDCPFLKKKWFKKD
ncbi:hypothetical protein D0T53_00020 [Dysgonomonas sp. 216]|uniref:hypothetical protein n=1 Tax=Dysgonomonas sp. 216 TaxID=2302934 RepID=UPI0013D497B2|nr:hypothetical protein [Dysgonomonas sp. 216]NDW17298.1 hypothetical protein [Dysgonomonas sp. 216]